MADDTLSMTYDVRRKARGGQPVIQAARWKNRLIGGGAALLAAMLIFGGSFIYYSMTYVTTIRAEVRGGGVSLAPPFDAPLEKIFVKEGEQVKSGQKLARFDDTERKAALDAGEAGVRLRKSRSEAARTGLESSKAGLELAKVRSAEEIRKAEANLQSAKARLRRMENGARPEEIEAAEARLASARALESLYTLELKQYQRLFERGIESEFDLEIKKTQLTTQKNVVREAELAVKKLKAGVREEEKDEARQEVHAREADLQLAKSSLQDVKRLELEVENRKALLSQAEAELRQAEADLAIRKAALESMVLTSPINGTVVRIFFNEGEVVRKGEVTVEVADDSKGRWVEGFILEKDGDEVQPGQKATVEIGIDSGDTAEATVDQVGIAKATSGTGRVRAFVEAGDYGRPAPVWVKLRFTDESLKPRPGTSANVSIRVR